MTNRKRSTPLRSASGSRVSHTLSAISQRETWVRSSSSFPASIFEKSSTSSIRRSKAKEESRIVRTASAWYSDRWPCERTSTMPMMPFMGVRISWLIVARKADFAAFAASACLFASSSSRVRFSTLCSSCSLSSMSSRSLRLGWSLMERE